MLPALLLASVLAAATPAPRPGEPTVETVRENAVVGELALLPHAGRRPAVIILGGFFGGVPPDAFRFAEDGYAGFAMAYFHAGSLPADPSRIPVETVSRAIDWLQARPDVDPSRIAVLGMSKGAELALLAAAHDKRIKTVALLSPTDHVWFAPVFDGSVDSSSWTENGGEVPFIPADRGALANLARTFQAHGRIVMRSLYDASLASASPAQVARATIPVERIAAPVLCIAGDDDRQWDSAGACRAIAARRHAAGRDAGDAVAIEPGAGHFESLAGRATDGSMPAGTVTLEVGGTLPGNSRALGDAFARIGAFFSRTL